MALVWKYLHFLENIFLYVLTFMEWNYRFSLFLDIYIKQNSNRDCPRDNDNELSSQKCTSLCCKKRDVTVSCLFNLRVCLCLFYICDACMQLRFDGRVVGLKDSGTLDCSLIFWNQEWPISCMQYAYLYKKLRITRQ